MPPHTRATLGVYTLGPLLGAGGMGEVYRARDPRLGRDVAVKVLPADVAADAERLRRFEREARAAAASQHPNVLVVHDFGIDADVAYLVTELLEGHTLRSLLSSTTSLPVKTILDIGRQMAAGLAAAHERGVVHRDLKPDNVYLTRTGQVKILDFGLAKVEPGLASATADGSTTALVPPESLPGMIVGTVGYMAPEQVRGQPVDARTDVFAFGCVMYELLTHQVAFSGSTPVDVLSAILTTTPPAVSDVRRDTPPLLSDLVMRCLARDPSARFQSLGDLSFVLAQLAQTSVTAAPPTRAAASSYRSVRLGLGVAAIAALAAAAGWVAAAPRGPAPRAPITFEIAAPAGADVNGNPAVSRDGQAVVVQFRLLGVGHLFLKRMTAPGLVELPDSQSAAFPFFSPDGTRVAFFSSNTLKVVDLATQSVVELTDVQDARGGTWTDDGRIIYAAGGLTALSWIPASGGVPPQPFSSLATDEMSHRLPVTVPGTEGVLFTSLLRSSGTRIMTMTGAGAAPREVIAGGTQPQLGPDGLYFVTARGELARTAFDVTGLTAIGDVEIRHERVALGNSLFTYGFAVAPEGTLVHIPHVPPERRLDVVGPGAQVSRLSQRPMAFAFPRVSPRGDQFAVNVSTATGWGEVWVGDLSGNMRPITQGAHSRVAVWAPSGEELAVESISESGSAGFAVRVDGGMPEPRRVSAGSSQIHAWLRNGQLLVSHFNLIDRPSGAEYRLLSPSTGAETVLPLKTAQVAYGRVSPDERWFLYTNADSGQWEVYLTTFPTTSAPRPVSQARGGREPVWAPDGRRVYFLSLAGDVMVADVSAAGIVGTPRSAGVGRFPLSPRGPGAPMYDVLPGGRFLVARPAAEQPPAAPLIVSTGGPRR